MTDNERSYTPSVNAAREHFAYGCGPEHTRAENREAFDRMLEAERAEAWFAGYAKGNLDGYFGTREERERSPYAHLDPHRSEENRG